MSTVKKKWRGEPQCGEKRQVYGYYLFCNLPIGHIADHKDNYSGFMWPPNKWRELKPPTAKRRKS